MITDASIAPVAALLAEPSRLAMLWALADARPRPAGELARCAGISAATASEHLARLLNGGLIVVEQHGRHRFYRIAGPDVVAALEMLGGLARPAPPVLRGPPAARALRHARTCYDHLAGALGVAVTRALVQRGVLAERDERFELSPEGAAFVGDRLGVDLVAARASRRQFARACLDWTERSHHIAGALGADLLRRFLELDWLRRTEGSRALTVSAAGRRGFRDVLDIDALGSRYDTGR
jgi:DNA-binding transcriptional ArsR family regulator